MNTLSDIIGAIIGYGLGIGFIVLCIGAFSAALGLAFPELRKEGGADRPDLALVIGAQSSCTIWWMIC